MDEKDHNKWGRRNKFGLGLVLGIGIGVALGVALDNIAIGIAIGAGIGVVFGAAWNNQPQENIEKQDDE